jgi:hypothetical protein
MECRYAECRYAECLGTFNGDNAYHGKDFKGVQEVEGQGSNLESML